MQWKNRKLPFFAYQKISKSEFILLISSYEREYFRPSHTISVDLNRIPYFNFYSKTPPYISKQVVEDELKEISELSQEQRRMAFISIFSNYRVIN